MRMLALTVPAADAELAADRLWAAGARAVEERDTADGRVELRTTLGDDDAITAGRVGELPIGWMLAFVDVEPEPAETWRDHAAPVWVDDDVVLAPAWLELPTPDAGLTVVRIEPGGAFGLGDHPTTRLTAAAVRRLARVGTAVLDVGCGTGVLAILALALGADRAVAIDIAEPARIATLDNAERNGVADRIEASTDPIGEVAGRYDLVLANVLAPELIAMAADLKRLTEPGGRLVVSGVLAVAHDHVLAALAPMVRLRIDVLDGWAAVELGWP